MTTPSTPWTPEVIAHLMRLDAMADKDPKITFKVMADRLNEAFGTKFTRNSIAGRLNMLRADTRSGEERKPRKAKGKPVEELKPEPVKLKLVQRPRYPPPAPPQVQTPPQSTHVTLLDRETWQCRWPVNDGGPYLFCGARKGDYDPNYCPHHRTVATGRR